MVEFSFDALIAEHDQQLRLISKLRQMLRERPPRLADAAELLAVMNDGLEEHLAEEERDLFPCLLRRLPDCSKAVEGLLREHVALQAGMTALGMALRSPEDPRHTIGLTFEYAELFARHAVREQQLIARVQLQP